MSSIRERSRATAELSDALATRLPDLVETWSRLSGAGPTLGSSEAGPDNLARPRYLVPLARLLIGALQGSADHKAVYLDERVRYVDPRLSVAERAQVLGRAMADEFDAVADLVAATALDRSRVIDTLWELHSELVQVPAAPLKLLFIGDCLFVETRAFTASFAGKLGRDLDIRHVFFSAQQTVDRVNDAIQNEVGSYQPDLIGISLYTFEGVPPYSAAWRQAAMPSLRRRPAWVAGLVELLRQTVEDIRAVSDAPVVVHTPGGVPLDPLRRRAAFLPPHSRAQRRLLSAMADGIRELVHGTVNTILIDERDIVRKIGARRAAAPLFDKDDVPSGYAHSTTFGPLVARRYIEILGDLAVLGAAKALLVDFDNTLWRGVMAEGPVQHDTYAQDLLLQLRRAGILLVALSKNDPSAIRWEEMRLKESDFALLKVNWTPKPDNVSAAIAELDLAPAAFVLLDDNPVERALVSEQVPGVATLDPGNADTWRALRNWLDFPSTTLTEEAARRTEMYRSAATRRAAMAKVHDYGTMMASLKLKCSVRQATLGDSDRILELVQRTTQFNTTTVRYSAADIRRFVADPSVGLYVATLSDRFGDLGVVAVVVFDRNSSSFELVAMSCRAMGFGLELAVLARIIDTEPVSRFVGRYIPTERNQPAASLFERAGFQRSDDGDWVLTASHPAPQAPTWFAFH